MTSPDLTRDLEALLRERARAEWARARGQEVELPGPVAEKVADLTSDETLASLLEGCRAAPEGDSRWWLLAAVGREAVAWRSRELRREIGARQRELVVPAPGGEVALADAEVVLARSASPARRDGMAGPLEDACGALTSMLSELAEARREARPRVLAGVRPEERARGRSWEDGERWARQLLADSDEAFARALAATREAEADRPSSSSWIDLPRLKALPRLEASMPPAGEELLRYVVASLSLGPGIGSRLEVVLVSPPERRPRSGVYCLEPGGRVVLARVSIGGPGDYPWLLLSIGEALSRALVERPSLPEDRLRDPAIHALHGALLEGLARDPAWVEAATRQPARRRWLRAVRTLYWLRLRSLAVQLLAGSEPAGRPLPARPAGEAWKRATGHTHPGGVVPWGSSPRTAADELAGYLVAPALLDRLRSRHGRDWFRSRAAGRELRDLWAYGAHTHLDALAADLDLGPIGLAPLRELELGELEE